MKEARKKQRGRAAGAPRAGKHLEGNTLFGCYVSPEIKALAVMTADALGITFTEIIINGLKHEATRAGILENDEIAAGARAAYDAVLEVVIDQITRRKGTHTKKGGRR